MKQAKKEKKVALESVKIEQEVVNLVRQNKKKTYIPIGEFFKIAAMGDGKKLLIRFPNYIGKVATRELDGTRLNSATFESLRTLGVIEFDRIEMGGNTKHHFRLTETGKSIEL